MSRIVFLLLAGAGLGLLLAPRTTLASSWQTLPASTLEFEGQAQGEAFHGEFERFTADIVFDPAALTESRFHVEVDLTSVNSQNEERDAMLADPAFFDSDKESKARYVAEAFEALGNDTFRADGVLTLRGVSRPVSLTLVWKTDGALASLVGEALLDRLAFDVGAGDWADPETIATAVKVMTTLQLSNAEAESR